jgi:hypothetical protein
MGGHQLRSIANLVTRDWQTADEYKADEKIKASTVQFRKAVARGASRTRMQKLLDLEVEYIRTVFWKYPIRLKDGTRAYKRVEYKVPKEWIYASTITGGAGVGRLDRLPDILETKLPKFDSRVHLSKTVRDYYGNEMTNDFWKKLHRLFPEMVNADPIHLAQVMHTYKADNIMGALPGFIQRSLHRKYAGQLAKFITKIREMGVNRPLEETRFIDDYTAALIRMKAHADMKKMKQHWGNPEQDLWHRGLNPLLRSEREIAKLPSKRKDVVSVWVEAIANICGVRKIEALRRLTIALGAKSEKGTPEMLLALSGIMPEKLLMKAVMGEIAFDNILGGWVATEVEQTIRNEGIWRCLEVLTSTRSGLNQKMIKDEAELQSAMYIYEQRCLEIIEADEEFRNTLTA